MDWPADFPTFVPILKPLTLESCFKILSLVFKIFPLTISASKSLVKDDIKEGDWICVTYLRWTNGFDVDETRMWAVEDKSILMMSETQPEELHEKTIN